VNEPLSFHSTRTLHQHVGWQNPMYTLKSSHRAGNATLCFLLFLAGGAFLAPPARAELSQVLGVRHWSGPEHTRVVLDLSSEIRFQSHFLQQGPRVYVDLSGAIFEPNSLAREVEDGVVRSIRLAQYDAKTVRLVADLELETRFKVFCLVPEMGKHHRLVLDLYRPSSVPFRVQEEIKRPKPSQTLKVVVLDPGHGGEDPGAIWYGLKEKDVVLDIARRVEKYLAEQENIQCFLTRRGDYYVSLKRRLECLKEWKGDIFLSVHINALPVKSKDKKVRGLEVFLQSTSGPTDEAARLLAARENAADFFGGENVSNLDEIDRLMEGWTRSGTFTQSETLAVQLMSELTRMEPFKTHNRGVKKANFYVLRTGKVPSVMLELGFLSHQEDATLLKTACFRDSMALQICNGINRYFAADPNFEPKYLKPEIILYQVKKGDSLWKLSEKHQVSIEAICEASDLGSRRVLHVGETLRIPPQGSKN